MDARVQGANSRSCSSTTQLDEEEGQKKAFEKERSSAFSAIGHKTGAKLFLAAAIAPTCTGRCPTNRRTRRSWLRSAARCCSGQDAEVEDPHSHQSSDHITDGEQWRGIGGRSFAYEFKCFHRTPHSFQRCSQHSCFNGQAVG